MALTLFKKLDSYFFFESLSCVLFFTQWILNKVSWQFVNYWFLKTHHSLQSTVPSRILVAHKTPWQVLADAALGSHLGSVWHWIQSLPYNLLFSPLAVHPSWVKVQGTSEVVYKRRGKQKEHFIGAFIEKKIIIRISVGSTLWGTSTNYKIILLMHVNVYDS